MAETVQNILIQDLLETEDNKTNETVELFQFMRDSGVPLTKDQLQGMYLLKEMELEDIANYVYNARRVVTPVTLFFKVLDKLTLADRIKGNAKLSHLLKASANPAGSTLKPEDVQAKGMSRREIDN